MCERGFFRRVAGWHLATSLQINFFHFVFIFLRMHQDYFFRRNLESVRAQFASANISLISGKYPANKLRNNYLIFRHFLVTNKRN